MKSGRLSKMPVFQFGIELVVSRVGMTGRLPLRQAQGSLGALFGGVEYLGKNPQLKMATAKQLQK